MISDDDTHDPNGPADGADSPPAAWQQAEGAMATGDFAAALAVLDHAIARCPPRPAPPYDAE